MRLPVKARHLPPRMVTGVFILNAGLGKWNADEERAARLHGFAVGTYPFLSKLKPKDFAKLLAAAEITLGSAPAQYITHNHHLAPIRSGPLGPGELAGGAQEHHRVGACRSQPLVHHLVGDGR
jgi:hypothetical protein